MSGGLFSRIVAWLRGGTQDEANEDDDSGFQPSRLDISVNKSHGMDTKRAEKELQDIQERAEEIEENLPEEFEEHR
jgi:hypothetical protein